MNFRRHISDYTVNAIPVLTLIFAVHYFLVRDDPAKDGIEMVDGGPGFYDSWQRAGIETGFDIDGEIERLELPDADRDRMIRKLLHQGKYKQAQTELLQVAADAVAQEDQPRLGSTLLLLGEVAINQQELATAEIYLQEALYLAMQGDDVVATARGYQLLGQLNISARELARHAANTWDDLWQARNAIARGYYRGVNENLQGVIQDNLEIRRYGAAADAWEAVAALHEKVHDSYQAQQARIEAARLYASTGQMTHVHRLVNALDRNFFSDIDIAGIEREVQDLFEEHQNDVIKNSQARDYQMLYHHYLRNGQVSRAWKFRIKSSETLAKTSDRSMFQRQGDIIAVLYNSNFAMERAKQYLNQANAMYNEAGMPEEIAQTRELGALIY